MEIFNEVYNYILTDSSRKRNRDKGDTSESIDKNEDSINSKAAKILAETVKSSNDTSMCTMVEPAKKVASKGGGKSKCIHGRRKDICKECGGKGICEHKREKSKCRDCGGKSICEHNRRRIQCKECGGSSICEHNRIKYRCKQCKEKRALLANM